MIGFLLSLWISTAGFAFTLNSSTNSDLQGWAAKDVQLLVNTTNCPTGIDVVGLISSAAEVWNKVATSNIKVGYGGSTTSTTYASPTTVYCETNFQAVTGADQNYVPGAASIGTSGGRVAAGVLFLNASAGNANIQNFDLTTLKIILAHEIGHILGLGHSASKNALMYYDGTPKKTLALSQDDIDGISYLYPSDEFKDQKIAGCGRVESLPPPRGPSAGLLVGILLLPFFVWAWLRNTIPISA